jgi:hypothetical protein
MRTSHILVVLLLGPALGGCFGVTLPPQPLPDWAKSPQAQYGEPRADQAPGAPRKKQRIVRQHAPNSLTAADSALVTGGTAAAAQPAARVMDSKPFAPGWDMREDERDPSLRQTMTICRGC